MKPFHRRTFSFLWTIRTWTVLRLTHHLPSCKKSLEKYTSHSLKTTRGCVTYQDFWYESHAFGSTLLSFLRQHLFDHDNASHSHSPSSASISGLQQRQSSEKYKTQNTALTVLLSIDYWTLFLHNHDHTMFSYCCLPNSSLFLFHSLCASCYVPKWFFPSPLLIMCTFLPSTSARQGGEPRRREAVVIWLEG